MPDGTKPLAGIGVVLTRPVEQASRVARRIEALGGVPILFPVLEIRDTANIGPLNDLIDRLDEFDLAIFISANAVNKAMQFIQARRSLPPRLKFAAIGKMSAQELARFGVHEVICPASQFDSEALLELPQLQTVAGQRIVIFRGEEGREVLGDTLIARGARLEYAECYRRAKPAGDAGDLLKRWARNEIQAVSVMSSESLRNLCAMAGASGQPWLKQTPLFVPHPRIASAARELGFIDTQSTEPGDEGLIAALLAKFTPQPQHPRLK